VEHLEDRAVVANTETVFLGARKRLGKLKQGVCGKEMGAFANASAVPGLAYPPDPIGFMESIY
jgi:hypothetical protein